MPETESLVNTFDKMVHRFSLAFNMKELGEAVRDVVDSLIEVEYSGFYFRDVADGKLRLLVAKGFSEEERKVAEATAEERHPGWVMRTGQVLHVPDVESDPEKRTIDSPRSFKVLSRLYIPVFVKGKVIGALGLGSSKKNAFSDKHIASLSLAAGLAGLTYDRIKKMEEVKRTESYLETLIQGISDIILTVSNEGNVVYCSPSLSRIIGRHVTPKDNFLDMLHPSDTAFVDKVIKELLELDILYIRIRDGKGQYRDFKGACKPVRGAKEGMDMLFTLHDITDDIIKERLLIQSEKCFRTLAERTPDPVIMIDKTGHIVFSNESAQRLFGWQEQELIVKDSLPPKMYSLLNKMIENDSYMETETEKQEFLIRNKDDQEIPVLAYIFAFDVGDQRRIGAILREMASLDKNDLLGLHQSMKLELQERAQQLRERTEELNEVTSRLRKALGGIIQAMARVVEARDPYTSGHQKRVANLARAIAQQMGLSSDIIEGIRIAGSIHDIGKIGVPAELLSKPGKLLDIEVKILQMHSELGYDILKEIDFPWPVADIVYQHHERVNGSGYPRGLKGNEILLEARIIGVADTIEAMTTDRPYRASLGLDAALNYVDRHKGDLFDSDVVDASLNLFKKGFKL